MLHHLVAIPPVFVPSGLLEVLCHLHIAILLYHFWDMSGFLSSEAEMALLGEEEEARRLFHQAMMEEQEQARRLYHHGKLNLAGL